MSQDIRTKLLGLNEKLVIFSKKIESHSSWLQKNSSPLLSYVYNLILLNESYIFSNQNQDIHIWLDRCNSKFKELGVHLSFNQLGPEPPCWNKLSHALPDILNELASNSIRHGKSTSIDLLCVHSNDKTLLTFTDNGTGFELDLNLQGLGVKNLLENEKIPGSSASYKKLDIGGCVCVITINHDVFQSSYITNETEEHDWANILHNSICPEILGVSFLTQQLLDEIPETESDLWYQIQVLNNFCQNSFDSLRELSHQLEK